jgi:hypothetical protein
MIQRKGKKYESSTKLKIMGVVRLLKLIQTHQKMITAIGFLQARMHFCAYFGMQGVFNFSPEIGKTDTVEQAEFRAMDRRKAWRIITYSAIMGAAVAIISYYLPA